MESLFSNVDVKLLKSPFRDMIVVRACGKNKNVLDFIKNYKELFPDDKHDIEYGKVKKISKRKSVCFILRWIA